MRPSRLSDYPHLIRQLVVRGLGREQPTLLLTNHHQRHPQVPDRTLRPTAVRSSNHLAAADPRLPPRLTLLLRPTPVDLDVVLSVLASIDLRLAAPTPPRLPDRHPRHPATTTSSKPPAFIHTSNDTITVRLDRRAYSPVLRSAVTSPTPPSPGGDRSYTSNTPKSIELAARNPALSLAVGGFRRGRGSAGDSQVDQLACGGQDREQRSVQRAR